MYLFLVLEEDQSSNRKIAGQRVLGLEPAPNSSTLHWRVEQTTIQPADDG